MTIQEAAAVQYVARPGGSIPQGRAQEVGEMLAVMEGKYGEVSPQRVVDEARNEEHPLHGDFEWDDTTAAHEYRLKQARTIIRCIMVTTNNAAGNVETVPVYTSLVLPAPMASGDEDMQTVRCYVTHEQIMSNDELRRRDLKRLVGRMMSMRSELSCHDETKPLVRELDRLHKRLELSVPLT